MGAVGPFAEVLFGPGQGFIGGKGCGSLPASGHGG